MPTTEEIRRGGAIRYRTVVVGRGKSRRYIHVAVVRKRGKRGGRTVAGPPRAYQRSGK